MSDRPISEAFDLIRQYAEREGWIPIGFRDFTVGPWDIRVNGTSERRDGTLAYHANVSHRDILAIMVLSPFDGTIGGWAGAEDQFIADMKAALA